MALNSMLKPSAQEQEANDLWQTIQQGTDLLSKTILAVIAFSVW